MENHIQNVKLRCRYGNCILDDKMTFVHKRHFHTEFEFFQINISEDDPNVHPEFVCNKHKALLHRCRSAIKNGETYLPQVFPFKFQMHNDNCLVCSTTLNDTGKKRKYAGPGRGKDGQGNAKSTPSFTFQETTSKKSSHTVCLEEFLKCDNGERHLFLKELVKHLSGSELKVVAGEVGAKISDKVKLEASQKRGFYRSIDNLINFNVQHFIESANPVLLEFIKNVCRFSDSKQKYVYGIAKLIEGFYKASQPSYVYALAFLNNLYIYVETGSRNVVNLIGAATGGGSYDTIVNWLKDQSGEPVKCPQGDVGNTFDNNQKIGKTWSVQVNSQIQASIVTTHIWLQLNEKGKLQADEQFLPGKLFRQLDELHYEQLYYVVDANITSLATEQILDEFCYRDTIDDMVSKAERINLKFNVTVAQKMV